MTYKKGYFLNIFISYHFIRQEFDYDTMDTEIVELSGWSANAKGKFVEWIDTHQKLVFKPKITRNGRDFGELFVHDEQFEEAYSVALRLCVNKMAIESADYMDYVNGEFNLKSVF